LAKKAKRSSVVSINFTGVQSRQKLPEDDYLVVVEEVNQTESASGNDQLEFVFKVKEGKYEDNPLWFYCPLSDTSLWKLHGLLTALGEEVPDDEMDVDLEDLVGKELMAVVTHETFEGVKRSKMTDFYPVEESASTSKKKEEPKSSKKDKEGENEKEMTPAEKRRARREARNAKKDKKPPKLSSDAVQEMDEEDLLEVIETYKLDIDLDDYKTLRKKAAAVVDVLEAEDMLDD
jgi:uncharacterized protein DUF669